MGEFLVSRAGIGYLIIYGTQVFNLSLVMAGILILLIISFLLYKIITLLEKKLIRKFWYRVSFFCVPREKIVEKKVRKWYNFT